MRTSIKHILLASVLVACGKSESKQPPVAEPTAKTTEPAVVTPAPSAPAPAPAAPAAPAAAAASEHLRAYDVTNPPSCLGFAKDGASAFVLVDADDRSVPTWSRSIASAGAAPDPKISAVAEGLSQTATDAEILTKLQPILAAANSFFEAQGLVPCTSAAGSGTGLEALAIEVGTHKIEVKLAQQKLSITVDGKPATAPAIAGDSLSLQALYTAAGAKGAAFVIGEFGEGGLSRASVHWIAVP